MTSPTRSLLKRRHTIAGVTGLDNILKNEDPNSMRDDVLSMNIRLNENSLRAGRAPSPKPFESIPSPGSVDSEFESSIVANSTVPFPSLSSPEGSESPNVDRDDPSLTGLVGAADKTPKSTTREPVMPSIAESV